MTSAAYSDRGMVLASDQAAITWSPREGFTFLFPHYADDAEVPKPVVALAVLAMKLQDETYLLELVDEFSSELKN